MNWQPMYQKLKKMVGMQLTSISGRSDITVVSVTPDSITINANRGTVVRPTSELRTIVAAMALNEPVHVDSVVKGSRSSRNQPETILANMPDVEWTKIQRKKHIIWVGKSTHQLGTLKQR